MRNAIDLTQQRAVHAYFTVTPRDTPYTSLYTYYNVYISRVQRPESKYIRTTHTHTHTHTHFIAQPVNDFMRHWKTIEKGKRKRNGIRFNWKKLSCTRDWLIAIEARARRETRTAPLSASATVPRLHIIKNNIYPISPYISIEGTVNTRARSRVNRATRKYETRPRARFLPTTSSFDF